MIMEFEKEITLLLDFHEYDKVESLLKSKTIIGESRCDEGVSVYLYGNEIDINFILELEDILDGRITLCSRYLGSARHISESGLD